MLVVVAPISTTHAFEIPAPYVAASDSCFSEWVIIKTKRRYLPVVHKSAWIPSRPLGDLQIHERKLDHRNRELQGQQSNSVYSTAEGKWLSGHSRIAWTHFEVRFTDIKSIFQSDSDYCFKITQYHLQRAIVTSVEVWAVYWPFYHVVRGYRTNYAESLWFMVEQQVWDVILFKYTFSPIRISSGQDESIHSVW